MANGRWQMADGGWQMTDGRWWMADESYLSGRSGPQGLAVILHLPLLRALAHCPRHRLHRLRCLLSFFFGLQHGRHSSCSSHHTLVSGTLAVLQTHGHALQLVLHSKPKQVAKLCGS